MHRAQGCAISDFTMQKWKKCMYKGVEIKAKDHFILTYYTILYHIVLYIVIIYILLINIFYLSK